MKAFPLAFLLLILARCNDANGYPTNSTLSTKLTDLDDYSLLSIFDYVDFMDLLHLASASDRIRQLCTDHIFGHKYRGIVIEFGDMLDGNKFESNKMRLVELDAQLEFLKYAGNLIRHLSYRFTGNVDEIFDKYVEKYLSSDVEAIDLIGNTVHLLRRTNRTFARVEKLQLSQSEQEFVPRIHRIFPNLKELIIRGSYERNFLYRYDRYLYDRHRSDSYERFLRKVLQSVKNLKKLNVYDIRSYDTLHLIRENNPTLEALTIGANISYFGDERPITFKHITKFSLRILDDQISGFDLRSEFPLHFDKLEVLEIDTNIFYENLIVRGLIERNVALKSLLLNWMSPSTIVQILQRVNGTHAIEEVAFKTGGDGSVLSSDDGVALMSSFLHLRKITLLMYMDTALVANMNNERVIGHILPGWNVVSVVRDESQLGSSIFQCIAIERV